MAPLSSVLLKKGARYQGEITLSVIESIALNKTVLEEFMKETKNSFADVQCTGTGRTRIVTGTWTKPDETFTLPARVRNIKELKAIPSLG